MTSRRDGPSAAARSISRSAGPTTPTPYVPEFWKFDAMIAYKVDDKSTVQLNVYNLTDTLYYSQYFGANVVPASGRWASLTYRAKW
jgi:catecholate siderophore receptor